MTEREEQAVIVLNTLYNNPLLGDIHRQALEVGIMAIKALEQEFCTDAVNRKELLKIYEDRFLELQKIKHLKDNKGAEDRQMGVNYCINILKEMPPVKPAEKVGRWKRISMDKYSEHAKYWYRCDRCGEDNLGNTNYCPHCGAKMQEVEE